MPPEMSPLQFNQLLEDVSAWWEEHGNVNMLKVILSEFKVIPVTVMEDESDPHFLFNQLRGSGLISRANIDVIIEIIVLGGQTGVESKIQKKLPTFPRLNEVEIKKFSKHRQNLLEFGKAINKRSRKCIGRLCNLFLRDLKDEWILILKLERSHQLTEDPKVKEAFVKILTENGMVVEANALNTFP
ncbi:uncharacterized protein LOC117104475 [Anneissia japonica]|uniref:uncharacterized protein LOC117104475 n=1 Tax=Anneissia japonica TaxID=1529436 RepID=UPI0014255D70|nr:uncharacterized protein LOC117104475 [Anneissia japonica]